MSISLPAGINIASARLPMAYEAAKNALANCASIDECKEWANKAEALASYAKQADDDALFVLARRIQSRAVNRCGELLKTFDGRGGDQSKTAPMGIFAPSRGSVAREAGLSPKQAVTAVRVSNVPREAFEAAVESDDPPSVTRLAEMGRKPRDPAPAWTPPEGFAEATQLLGTVKRFAEFCRANDPARIAGGVMPYEAAEAREMVATIDAWLDRFIVNLRTAA